MLFRSQMTTWQHVVRQEALSIAKDLVNGAGQKALIGRLVGSDSGEHIVNAGTLLQQLKRKLATELPLTVPETVTTAEGENNG